MSTLTRRKTACLKRPSRQVKPLKNGLRTLTLIGLATILLGVGRSVVNYPPATHALAATSASSHPDGDTGPGTTVHIPEQQATVASIAVPAPVVAPVATPAPIVVPTGSVASWMAAAGVSASDWTYVNYIMGNESGACPTKWQGERTCPDTYSELYDPSTAGVGYGLCQSTPAIKMSTAGADWATNPVTQMRWCDQYANSRYGGWANAAAHWKAQIAIVGHGNW